MREIGPLGFPRDLCNLPLDGVRRVLVLAPHPDDVDAIGVTLRRDPRRMRGCPPEVGI